MVKSKQLLAVLAATGLVVAGPAFAATRAASALPAQQVELDPASVARTGSAVTEANELGGRLSPALLLAFLAILGALLAAAGGGGSDSPG